MSFCEIQTKNDSAIGLYQIMRTFFMFVRLYFTLMSADV